jgi:heptosyltransferase-1
LCARALGYEVTTPLRFGLHASSEAEAEPADADCVAFVHGTSRADKCWPEENWVELGRRLMAQQRRIALLHGDNAEHERAQRLAQALGPAAQVWPRLDLGKLTDRLAGCAGVIGVDSGLSHVAVALDLPHVQIYNFDTSWRTGPLGSTRQMAVYGTPTPTVDAVWQAWQRVAAT